MSDYTLDEALASTNSNEQTRSISHSDRTPLVIDNDLRTIRVPNDYVFGVFNDKDVLAVPFEMPRYYDGLDLSEFSIQINYVSADETGDIYEVPSSEIEISESTVYFKWLLGSGVFLSNGNVTFVVCLRQMNQNGEILNEYNTTIAKGLVLEGLEVEDAEDPTQYGILVRMRDLLSRAETAVEGVILESDRLDAVENVAANSVTNGWVENGVGYFAHGEDVLFSMTGIGGSTGTTNYNDLTNKPKIESVELSGDKSFEELNLKRITNTELENMLV